MLLPDRPQRRDPGHPDIDGPECKGPDPKRFHIHLPKEEDTVRLGIGLAPHLGPGDTVLLSGALGAGKSALARAVIAALLDDPQAQIPSPSYTLVNVYETPRGSVWHADLYRLSGEADELEQIGLEDAATAALLLVEWPERLGTALQPRRIDIALSIPKGGGRDADLTLHGPGWDSIAALLERWR